MQRAKSTDYQKEVTEGQGFNSCDTYALAAAINDKLITSSEEVSILFLYNKHTTLFILPQSLVSLNQVAVTVELEGKYTRGMMVLDYMELLNKKHKAFVMQSVDLERFKEMLMKSLQ